MKKELREVKRIVMAIGAHADDIEINAGATLLKYHDLGYQIIYVMSTNNMSGSNNVLCDDGTISATQEVPADMMARRKRECDDAAKVLSTTPIHLDHPQGGYNTGNGNERVILEYGSAVPSGVPHNIPNIMLAGRDAASINRLADLILEKDPECILTHGVSQVNLEHSATSLLVTKAFWKAAEQGYEGGLLHWVERHTLNGEYQCRWETFIDGTGYLDRKIELIGLHRCQMPTIHYPDNAYRIWNKARGRVCGCEVAEPFYWVRRPVRRSTILSGVYAPLMGELTVELIQNAR